jgi:hypothetical protein
MAFFNFLRFTANCTIRGSWFRGESLVHEERTNFLKSSSSSQDWLNFKGEGGGSRNSRTIVV